jgi:hypothetical protein
VVLYYDYLLTLPREINCVWARGFNRVSAIFYLNRYPSLLFEIVAFVFTFGRAGANESVCSRRSRFPFLATDRFFFFFFFFHFQEMRINKPRDSNRVDF